VPESEHSQENLASVRTHMERIEQLVRFQILANKQNCEAVQERLSARAGMAEAYLAVGAGDRPRTQDELAAALGKSQPTVSRILKELYDAGLVIKVASVGNRQIMAYAWSDLEPLLGVARIARRLVGDAGPSPATSGRRDGSRRASRSPAQTGTPTTGSARSQQRTMLFDDPSTLTDNDDHLGREASR
jgi:DNA-binding transcriptional ArsR family regulator